jgi:hypothetical protein
MPGGALISRARVSGVFGFAQNNLSGRVERLVAMVFDILGERLELGLLEQFPKGALSVPIRGEVMTVVFAEVLDFGRGMLVIDPSVLVARATVKARMFGGFTHANSFRA